ncbi:MAG: hypothetical protein QG596_971 [Actinomycetota bacterium]|nr:hypothetical protein [Actinomycetota bacterium]
MAASARPDTGSRRKMWITLIAMTVSSAMILVDQTSVPLAIPDAMSDLDGEASAGQWILTANMLPLAFMVLGGRLGDIFGLRKIFIIGAVIFSAASAMLRHTNSSSTRLLPSPCSVLSPVSSWSARRTGSEVPKRSSSAAPAGSPRIPAAPPP